MKAANDTTVVTRDLAAALRQILPLARRNTKKDLGSVTIAPAPSSALRLTSFFASVDVPAEGEWTDTISVSARFLSNLAKTNPPRVLRLLYFDGTLALNNISITASTVSAMEAVRKPRNRLIR